MKKRILKRLTGALLSVLMMMSMIPATFAVGNDIDGNWAEASLQNFINDGYLNGDGDGNYKPNQIMTRAQFAAILNRLTGLTTESTAIVNYTDISSSDWYYSDLAKALAAGYMQGTSTTTMSPNATITREEAFVMIGRYLKLDASDTSALNAFEDADGIAEYAKGYVSAMITAGYVQGIDGKIQPNKAMTRAEGVTVLDRSKTPLQKGNSSDPKPDTTGNSTNSTSSGSSSHSSSHSSSSISTVSMQAKSVNGKSYYYGEGDSSTRFKVNGQTISATQIGNTAVYYYTANKLTGDLYGTANVPYADFYYGELNTVEVDESTTPQIGSDTAKSSRSEGMYDAVTSATVKVAPKFATTYSTVEDDKSRSKIFGIKTSVKISADLYAQSVILNAAGVTADNQLLSIVDSMTDISTTEPERYKEIYANGTLSELKVNNAAAAPDTVNVTASITAVSVWGNYEIDFKTDGVAGLPKAVNTKTNVLGVVIETENGTKYGLKQLDNIWLQNAELVLNVQEFVEPHGNSAGYQRFVDLQGQTIKKITYLMSDSEDKVISCDLYCGKLIPAGSITIDAQEYDNSVESNTTAATVTFDTTSLNSYMLPAPSSVSCNSTKLTENTDYTYDSDSKILTILKTDNTGAGSYKVTFDTSGDYADTSVSFILDCKFGDSDSIAIQDNILIDSGSIDAAKYLKAISAVTINGTTYTNSYKQKLTLFKANGNDYVLDLDGATSGETQIFPDGAEGTYTLEITASGYPTIYAMAGDNPLSCWYDQNNGEYESFENLITSDSTAITQAWTALAKANSITVEAIKGIYQNICATAHDDQRQKIDHVTLMKVDGQSDEMTITFYNADNSEIISHTYAYGQTGTVPYTVDGKLVKTNILYVFKTSDSGAGAFTYIAMDIPEVDSTNSVPANFHFRYADTIDNLNLVENSADWWPVLLESGKENYQKANMVYAEGGLTAPEFADGDGTEESPYQIENAQELNNVRNHLDSYFKLTEDIDLSTYSNWEPIGDMSAYFTGTFDGDGYKISNLNTSDDQGIGVGLFGVSTGIIKNFTIDTANVTGVMAVGAAAGYNIYGTIDNVTVKDATINGLYCVDNEMMGGPVGANCIGGVIGGNEMGNIADCMAENVAVSLGGSNTFEDDGPFIQCDIAECAGLIVGGSFGGNEEDVTDTTYHGTISGCTATGTITATGTHAVGLGGIGGCLEMMESISDCAADVTINATKAHAIGGLCGYTGSMDPKNPMPITNCSATVKLDVPESTHVGGLVGTGLYYVNMETVFSISDDCSVSGTINARSDEKYTPGSVVGRAAGSEISDNITVNNGNNGNVETLSKIGTTEKMYRSGDGSDNDADAADLLDNLNGTYEELFPVLADENYAQDWLEACAKYLPENTSEEAIETTAAMLRSFCMGTVYGQDAVDTYTDPDTAQYDCYFINGVKKLAFNGSIISGVDENGETVFSHAYRFISYNKDLGYYEYESTDVDSGEFTYFLMRSDTPASTYHIELRYGSDLDALESYTTGKYAYWMAAGIPLNRTADDIKACIDLFCEENLSE